jgi:hypothetical protein
MEGLRSRRTRKSYQGREYANLKPWRKQKTDADAVTTSATRMSGEFVTSSSRLLSTSERTVPMRSYKVLSVRYANRDHSLSSSHLCITNLLMSLGEFSGSGQVAAEKWF